MVVLLGAIFSLLLLILKEYFSASAKAKEEGRVFKIDQDTLRAIVNAALEKQVASMAKVSAGQGSGWDAADQDAAKKVSDRLP